MDQFSYLDFEKPLIDLQQQIDNMQGESPEDVAEHERLQKELQEQTRVVFSGLTSWQKVGLARHILRPHALDYIRYMFTDYTELHGDRQFGDDPAIVGGLARFRGKSVMVIGHEKGQLPEEKRVRNFGMPQPEGLRKALRLMKLAERYGLPVLTLVDTPGAYPGIAGEERNQNEAIAVNLATISSLRVPVIATVIGEGGSGGALAIGCGDAINMLQYSIYSVATPEACASIVWRAASFAEQASETMGIVPERLHELKVIDHIVPEPHGGAHRDRKTAAKILSDHLYGVLEGLEGLPVEELLQRREQKFRQFGD